MNRIKSALFFLSVLFVFAACTPIAEAQGITSNFATTALSYSSAESLTISVDTPSLTLTTAQQTVNVTTTWNLATSRTSVNTIATFNNATTALTGVGVGNIIPPADILSQGMAAEVACTGDYLVWNGGLRYPGSCDPIQNINTTGNENGTLTSPFKIRLAPSAIASIPADSYTGTLTFVAGAL
jgi:hypothetical protein